MRIALTNQHHERLLRSHLKNSFFLVGNASKPARDDYFHQLINYLFLVNLGHVCCLLPLEIKTQPLFSVSKNFLILK